MMKIEVHIRELEFDSAIAEANLTNRKLAKRLGIGFTYLSGLKSARQPHLRPSPALRVKLMKVLKKEFDDLFAIRKTGKHRIK